MNPKLTLTASNRNRLDLDSDITKTFLKSIQWQDYRDFELLIADGGSDNYDELKDYFASLNDNINIRIVQYKIGEAFERAKLNNVGVRNALGEYIMTTDVDMIFGPQFVSTLMRNVGENKLVESRTMYLKGAVTKRIYSGELDPLADLESIKKGRIKKRTTAGGCQCMHINSWNKIHGFDENYVGWGSEDYDLMSRAKMAGLKVVWMGETRESIMLFHQAHAKDDIKKDLEYQEENKKLLNNIKNSVANSDSWGGKPV